MPVNEGPGHERLFRVLIVGAVLTGATGLTIAQGLKQAGIDCAIFERTDHTTYAHRSRDWSMGLHWGSSYLQNLPPEITSQLKSAETDPWTELTPEQETTVPVVNGRTGEVIAKIAAISSRRVVRSKLRQVLSYGLDVEYGKDIVSISVNRDGVKAAFADGTEAFGNALVGCDSTNSFVRNWLVGAELAKCEELPIVAYNFTVQYSAEQARWLRDQLHPLLKCAPHPDQKTWFLIPTLEVKDPDDPITWVFQLLMNLWTSEQTPESSEERLAHFKKLAAGYAEPFRSAAAWVPEETYVPYDRIKHWPCPVKWNNHGGRVTLAGDAAHPMAPHRAQGLNNALQDAAGYVSAIVTAADRGADDTSSLRTAIGSYDKEMFDRGAREIKVSADQAFATMHWDHYMDSPVVKHGHASIMR